MTGRVICSNCRHPRPLHSNGTSGCKARGCHAGPDGGPCAEFTPEIKAVEDRPAVLTPKFQAPDLPLAASG